MWKENFNKIITSLGITRRVTIYLIGILLVSIIGIACHRPERPGAPLVLATINGQPIFEENFRFRIKLDEKKFLEQTLDKKKFIALKKETLNRIIQNRIIIDWGAKQGIVLDESEKAQGLTKLKKGYTDREFETMLEARGTTMAQWSEMNAENLGVQKVLKEALYKNIKISQDEIEGFYKKNKEKFKTEARVHVRHIVTDSEEKAIALRTRIKKGENFAELAIMHSLSPDRDRGGELGYFAKGTYPEEFDKTCFSLTPGEISPVVKSPYGYHIFKLLDKKPAGFLELAEVLPQIEAEILKQKMEESFTPWYNDLREKAQVEINDNALKAIEL